MRNLTVACLVALAVALGACSSPRRDAVENVAACNALAKVLRDQEQGFVAEARAIRAEHVSFQEYDRRMIDAITTRRTAIQATKLTELSVSEEVCGCSGDRLDDLRYRAQQEMSNLRDYLNDFTRALKTDPTDLYIDQP